MAQAKTDNNTRRRDFLALTAAVATVAMAQPALASPQDDSALLAMEEQYFGGEPGQQLRDQFA